MRKLRNILYLMSFTLVIGCTSSESSIKVGQTWKYAYDEDNPYEKATIRYKEVIEITGDYVLYIKDNRDTLHDTKHWFIVGSECVKNCD